MAGLLQPLVTDPAEAHPLADREEADSSNAVAAGELRPSQPPHVHVVFTEPVKPAPALTVRAVTCGLCIGSLLCFSNMYFGLQTGFITMGALQAAIVGFGVFKALQGFGYCRDFSLAENVIIQTVSGATATMPLGAGMVGVLPAFTLLTPEQNPPLGTLIFSPGTLIVWTLALAFIGTFMAVPLRTQTIIREQLKFPTGTATANVIATLHGQNKPGEAEAEDAPETDETDEEATTLLPPKGEFELQDGSENPLSVASRRKASQKSLSGVAVKGLAGLSDWTKTWATLLWTFVCSFGYTIAAGRVAILQSWNFFDWFGYPAATPWGWAIAPAVGYIGQGMIMGPRTTLSMLLGAIVGYGILGPYSRQQGYAPGPIGDIRTGATGWILWISLAIMLGDSLTSFSTLIVTSVYKSFFKKGDLNYAVETVSASQQIPTWWWMAGMGAAVALCTAILTPLMHLPVYEPIIAAVVAILISILSVRALGETDLNPVSGIGKVSQVLFAFVSPGNVLHNLVAGAIAEAGAEQAGVMMQDFKTAHLLGISPRAQFGAMLIGSTASIFVSSAAYLLYTSAFQVPGPDFPAPTAAIWLDMAELVNGGRLPPRVLPYAGAAAVIAAIIPIIRSVAAAYKARRDAAADGVVPRVDIAQILVSWLPSGIAFAVGIYVSPRFTIPRVAGALVEQIWVRVSPSTHSKVMIVVASGLVLGEGTGSIVNAVSKAIEAVTSS